MATMLDSTDTMGEVCAITLVAPTGDETSA